MRLTNTSSVRTPTSALSRLARALKKAFFISSVRPSFKVIWIANPQVAPERLAAEKVAAGAPIAGCEGRVLAHPPAQQAVGHGPVDEDPDAMLGSERQDRGLDHAGRRKVAPGRADFDRGCAARAGDEGAEHDPDGLGGYDPRPRPAASPTACAPSRPRGGSAVELSSTLAPPTAA